MKVEWSKRALEVIELAFQREPKIRRGILKIQIEQLKVDLGHAPHKLGESRWDNYRICFYGLFELFFRIELDEVRVVDFRILEKTWPDFEPPNDPI